MKERDPQILLKIKDRHYYTLILLLLIFVSSSHSLDKCTNTKATLYDGFLDPAIYYASFSKDAGSYFKFRNPFEGITNMTQGSVMFWIKFPKVSDDGMQQKGTFLECANQFYINFDTGNNLRFNLSTVQTTKTGALTTVLSKNQLIANIFSNNSQQLRQWNHYSFSFKTKLMIIHINGVQLASVALNNSFVNNPSDYCIVGNSMDQSSPLNAYVRHLIFSNLGFDKSIDITTKSRQVALPSDTSLLAYFKFSKEFKSQETYYYNSTRDFSSSNVQILSSSEPELVCYCTKSNPSFLKLTKDFKLKALDISPYNGTIDQTGVTLTFTIYPQNILNESDQSILSIQNYTDVVLVSQGKKLRVDIYNDANQVQQQFVFSKYVFRQSFWTTYIIKITTTKVTLSVDGVELESQTHNAVLPTKKGAKVLLNTSQNLTFLLYSIEIKNDQQTFFSRQFTQDQLIPTFQTQNVTSGKLVFEANNQLCSNADLLNPGKYNEANKTCKNNRIYPNFNNASLQTSQTASLKSSMTNMTIEMWIKDMSPVDSVSKTPYVLLENTADNKNTLVQIGLQTSTSSTNPTRQFIITPQVSSKSTQNAILITSQTYNNWIHLSVVSNSTALKVLMFNHTTQVPISTTQQGLIMQQYPIKTTDTGLLNTSIGSSFNGANKFMGFIRDLRIWKVARTDTQIEQTRYNGGILSFAQQGHDDLTHYFRMNDGLAYENQFDAIAPTTKYFDEKALDVSSFEWKQDLDLVICSQGYYYDGQCCQQVTLAGTSFNFAYSASGSKIIVSLVDNSLNHIYADFELIQVGYNFDTNYTQTVLNKAFNVQQSKGFIINSAAIKPLAYNLTIRAKIYSLYDSQATYSTKTLVLKCPLFQLTLNDLPQSQDDSYIVSNSTNHMVQIKALTLDTLCYNPAKNIAQTITVNRVAWTSNNAKTVIATVFDTSTDGYTLTQKLSIAGLTSTRLTARVYYNNSNTYFTDVYLDLNYQKISIDNGYTTSTILRNYVKDSAFDLDFTSASIQNQLNQDGKLYYQVICPSELFKNTTHLNNLCKFNSTSPRFTLQSTQNQNLTIKYNRKYIFIFNLGIYGGSIIKQLQVNVSFSQDGTFLSSCPSLNFNENYDYNKIQTAVMEISPDPYLYCNGVFYEFSSSNWTVLDQLSKKAVLNTLNFTSEAPLSVFLRKDNINVQKVIGGQVLELTGKYSFRQASQTAYLTTNATLNKTLKVTFATNPLLPQIVLRGSNKVELSSSQIAFLETNVTLDASSSFDPDNSTAALSFSWQCPSLIPNCTALMSGTKNNSLTFDLWLKFHYDFQYNTNYTFTLTIWTKDNPFKAQQSLDFNISFAQPSKLDQNTMMPPTTCETMSITQNDMMQIQQDTQDKIITFSKSNFSSINFDIVSKYDNGSAAAKSPCGTGNVTSQLVFFYIFDGVFDNQSKPDLIFSQSGPLKIQKVVTLNQGLSNYDKLTQMPSNSLTKASIYMFTQRLGSNKTYLNIQNIYFQKTRSSIMIVLDSTEIYQDMYNNLVLDASKSYDGETNLNTGFKYYWSCPNDLAQCKKETSSKLTLTYSDRVKYSINDANNAYAYSLYIVDKDNRTSETVNIQVIITRSDDYSNCIEVTSGSATVGQDFEQNNRTIFLEYDQLTNVVIQMVVLVKCDNVKVKAPLWSNPDENVVDFWVIDSTNQNRIIIKTDSIKAMEAGQINTVNYRQDLQMGSDDQIYNYQTYVNFYLNTPDLIPIIQGQSIYIYGVDTDIVLDASASIDPINDTYSCSWNCPSYFGGDQCSQDCNYTFKFDDLIQRVSPESINAFLKYSHKFDVTITSSDNQRVSYASQAIYFSDTSSYPFDQQGIRNCEIKSRSLLKYIEISTTNTYHLDCGDGNAYIENEFFNQKYYWQVDGLAQDDFYTKNNELYLKPYALAKISYQYLSISLVQPTYSNTRLLQEENNDDGYDSGDNNDDTNIPDDTDSSGEYDNGYDNGGDQDGGDDGYDNGDDGGNDYDNGDNGDNGGDDDGQSSGGNEEHPVYSTDKSITRIFSFKRNILQQGSIQVYTDDNPQQYISKFLFEFSDFQSSSNSKIYFQLRAYQPIYSAQNILIPLKSFNQDTIDNYYQNIQLPIFSEIYVDFYDITYKYLGSKNLYYLPQLYNLSMGHYEYNDYDKQIFPVLQRTLSDYQNSDQGSLQIELDIYKILIMIEMLENGGVYQSYDALESNYAQKTIAYLKLNFRNMLATFDPTLSLDIATIRYNLQKEVLLISYNLIYMGSGAESKVLSMIDILDACTQDYDQMMEFVGDPELVRYLVLYIKKTLTTQLTNTTLTSKQVYYDRLDTIESTVYSNDLKQSQNIDQSTSTVDSDKFSRTILQIKDDQSAISVTNNLNKIENFDFGNQKLLSQLGAKSLLIEFSKEINVTSALQSGLQINAYDSTQKIIEVNFVNSQSSQNSFNFQLQLNNTVRQLIMNANANTLQNYTYDVTCVYYDKASQKYSTYGVQTASLDVSSGMVKCKSYHLSQFSAIYTQVLKSSITDKNNQTNGNSNNSNNGNKGSDSGKYYDDNTGAYAAAIILVTIAAFLFMIIACCCKYKSMMIKPAQNLNQYYSFCKVFLVSMKIFHPIFNSIIPLRNTAFAIPRVYHMITLWNYAFFIVLSSLLGVLYLADDDFTAGKIIAYAAIMEGLLFVLRPIHSHIIYSMYHKNTEILVKSPQKKVWDQASSAQDKEGGPDGANPSARNNNQSKREDKYRVTYSEARLKSQDNMNFERGDNERYEGGESESGYVDEEEEEFDSSHSQDQAASQRQLDTGSNITGMNGEKIKQPQNQQQHTPDKRGFNSNTKQQIENLKSAKLPTPMKVMAIQIRNDDKLNESNPDSPQMSESQSPLRNIHLGKRNSNSPVENNTRVEELNQFEMDGPNRNFDDASPFEKVIKDDPIKIPQQSPRQKKVVKKDEIIEIGDIDVDVESAHNFQGARCALLALQLIIMIVFMIIIYAIMKQLETQDDVTQWIYVVLGVFGFLSFIFDTLRIMIFACFYKPKMQSIGFVAFLFLGNSNRKAIQSLYLELQEL